jgi:DNA-binding transcriptional LysR family regulator
MICVFSAKIGVYALDWNDVRYFLAVARSNSLTEAARELRVSQATIARRIAALEDAVAKPLFRKTNSGYFLTAAGEAFVAPSEQAEASMLLLQRSGAIESDEKAGVVRLAIPELFGQYFIIPSLASFCEQYPMIGLEAVADVRPLALNRRDADVLVRLVRPDYGNYVVRKIGRIALGLYASSKYIEKWGEPRAFSELSEHRLIGWDPKLSFLPFNRWLADKVSTHSHPFRSHTMSSQFAAVSAGIGLAVLPAFVANQAGLLRVVKEEEAFFSDLWLLQAADAQNLLRVRLLADYLSDTIGAAEGLLTRLDP